MIRVAILVEGQTEGEFVKRILDGHLYKRGVLVQDCDLRGRVDVHKIAREMCLYCQSFDVVTSFGRLLWVQGQERCDCRGT